MSTIYKYTFATMSEFSIDMPDGAEILTVQVQDGIPRIWAKVDPEAPKAQRNFEAYGTGQPISGNNPDDLEYIGTYQLKGGEFVFHLFENVNASVRG